MAKKRGPRPRVEYDGRTYSCKRWNVEIPDLDRMSEMEALVWLNQNTTPRGYSRTPAVNLRGYADAANLVIR